MSVIFSALINNITLIVALSLFYSFIIRRWKYGSRSSQIISGFLFGAVAVVGMMNPLIVSPGLIFDGRSIIISIAGFIGGWVTALIAAVMSILCRAWLGGTGAIMGVSVITLSAAIGIVYYYLRRRKPDIVTPLHLIGFGIIVHIGMLAMTMTLPVNMRFQVFSNMALPVILIYPLGTLLVCVVLLDLESRRRAKEALQESEEQFKTIFEMASIGMAQATPQAGQWLRVNQKMCDITGYSSSELLAMTIPEITHPEDRERDWHAFQNVVNGRVPNYQLEKRYIRKDGTIVWVNVNMTVIHNLSGQPLRTIATIEDITNRKRAEEALRQSEKNYRLLFENMMAGFALHEMIYDGNGNPVDYRYLEINPAFEKLTGKQAETLVGHTIKELMPHTEAYWIETYGKVVKTGVPIAYQNYAQEIGRYFDVWAFSPAKDRFAVVFVDVTEQKQADEERRLLAERLQRSEKMEALGLLSGGVAHDLNNVLGILIGYSELLLLKIEESSPVRAYVTNIMGASERAAAIVQDMLTLARRGVQDRKAVNLNTLVLHFLKAPEFEGIQTLHSNIEVKTNLEAELLPIMGAPAQLDKTIMNLVVNAAEAMTDGGLVTIMTRNQYMDRPIQGYDEIREGDYVVLSVSDSGVGIPADDIQHIFEPFYTKKVMGKSGTGLGLAVVWGTVKDHNGYIDVRSEEGRGSTFSLYFPVTREELPVESVKLSLAEYLGHGESMLVVDDVSGQRDLAAEMLRKLNYSVTVAASGEEALTYLQDHEVNLMVLDMIMDPGMDGLDTYRKVLEIHPNQKAIIVSGFSETDRVRMAHDLGAGVYVKKPYVLEKLGLAVRKELERSSSTPQN